MCVCVWKEAEIRARTNESRFALVYVRFDGFFYGCAALSIRRYERRTAAGARRGFVLLRFIGVFHRSLIAGILLSSLAKCRECWLFFFSSGCDFVMRNNKCLKIFDLPDYDCPRF